MRRLGLIGGLLLYGCLAAAAAAQYGPPGDYRLLIERGPDVSRSRVWAAPAHSGSSYRITVLRDGRVVAQGVDNPAWIWLAKGDEIWLRVPSDSPQPVRTWRYTPGTTIEQCDAGADAFGGLRPEGSGADVAGVSGSGSGRFDSGPGGWTTAKIEGGARYTARIDRPLASDDVLAMRTRRFLGDTYVEEAVETWVGRCHEEPPATGPLPPLVHSEQDGQVQLSGVRLRAGARRLSLTALCAWESSVPCAGRIEVRQGRRLVLRRSIQLPIGASRRVSAKLGRRQRRALARSAAPVIVRAITRDRNGRQVVPSVRTRRT